MFELRTGLVEGKCTAPNRPRKLDAFANKRSAWPHVEASKSREQRRTIARLYADLASIGSPGIPSAKNYRNHFGIFAFSRFVRTGSVEVADRAGLGDRLNLPCTIAGSAQRCW